MRVLYLWSILASTYAGCSKKCDTKTKSSFEFSKGKVASYWRNKNFKEIGKKDSKIEIVSFYNHGNSENGDDYFCFIDQSATNFACGGDKFCKDREKIYTLGGQFYSHRSDIDQVADNEIVFDDANDWNCGNDAENYEKSSFDVLDSIFNTFLNKTVYPNLKVLNIAGHSGGGQLVGRYSLASKLADDVEINYRPF